nr:hypothetical protein [Verrucomicrobiota bacterium]
KMTTATSAEFPTIFRWDSPKSRKLSLLSFLAASVVLHSLCFYLFQIVYPAPAAPLPPPARVSLITDDTDEGRVLLRWIEAEDPALSSTTQRPAHIGALLPPKPAYLPSYINRQPSLAEVPPFEPDLRVPSARPPAPVPQPPPAAPVATAPIPTTVQFSAATESLGAPSFPPAHFTASGNEQPQAAQFRVVIGPRGEVRHCFLQTSSGDSALDEQARRYLLLTRFPDIESRPDPGALWTIATLEWGNDIVLPSANPPEPGAP